VPQIIYGGSSVWYLFRAAELEPRILRWILEGLSIPAVDYSLHSLSYPGLRVLTARTSYFATELWDSADVSRSGTIYKVELRLCVCVCVVKWKLWNWKQWPDFHWPLRGQGDDRVALQFLDHLLPC